MLDLDFSHISVANEGICVKFGSRMLPYKGIWGQKSHFVQFMMMATWIKFGTEMENDMQMVLNS